MLKAFEKTEEFVGTLYVEGEMVAEKVWCRCVINPLDTRALKATVYHNQSFLDWEGELPRIVVKSDPSRRYTQVQVEGFLKRSTLNFGSRADIVEVNVQQVFQFSSLEIDHAEKESTKIYRNWFFPPLAEIGGALQPEKRPEQGLVAGWSPHSLDNWEEGKWEPQRWPFELGNHTFVARPNFSYKTVETHEGEAYIAVPRFHVRNDLEVNKAPETLNDAVEHLKTGDDIIGPLVLALRFVTATRLGSSYQVQASYDPETKISAELKRYVSNVNREVKGVSRLPQFQSHWELIIDMAQAIQNRTQNEKKFGLIRRAIHRYLEALEAPLLEMKLVLMHSALTLVVTERDYDMEEENIELDEDLPSTGGRLLSPLKCYLSAKEVRWKDLAPDGEKELFYFNQLRNEYLKDLEHSVDSAEPFEIARKLFERVLLADLGLSAGDYSLQK